MIQLLHRLAGVLLGALLLLHPGLADAQARYVPTAESRVWIEGTSTADDFTCSTQQIEGRARLSVTVSDSRRSSASTVARPVRYNTPAVSATVPVRTLDCGKRRQNRDLYEAMKAEKYPTIHYKLFDAEVVSAPDSANGHYTLRVTGQLIIAGVRRTVRITVKGQLRDDGRIHARGSLPMKMTDFEIDPPTALLGLIRVRDEIEVHFDLTARRATVSNRQTCTAVRESASTRGC